MEEEDDLLDELLETMSKSAAGSHDSQVCTAQVSPSSSSPGITFSFPGWGIDIRRDCKRQMSLVRYPGSETSATTHLTHSSPKVGWIEPRAPAHTSPVANIPDELLLRVFQTFPEKDLAVSRQVCRRWYGLSSSDCLWEKFTSLKAPADSDIPRWMFRKHSKMLLQVSSLFTYSKKGYEHFIEALDAWWEHGQPHGRYSSSSLCPLIRKATLSDWCVFYELLSWAFLRRADYLASMLLDKLRSSRSSSYPEDGEASIYDLHVQKDVSPRDGRAGMEICQSMRSLWHRYISWVKLVSLHCTDLNYAIRIERGRTVNTPTLYNKAVICFRSQVVLSYRLRQALQAGLSWLSAQDSKSTASEHDVELLCSLHHLLQELDVADDFTLPHATLTQVKFRRCFLDGESSKDYSRAQIIAARKDYM